MQQDLHVSVMTNIKESVQVISGMEKQEKYQSLITLLRDKSIAHEKEYTYLRDSPGSASAYIAKENATTNTFILKKFYKNVEAGEKAIKALYYENVKDQIKKNSWYAAGKSVCCARINSF